MWVKQCVESNEKAASAPRSGLPVPRLQSRYLQLYTFSTSHFKLINTGLSHSRGHYIISPNINNFYCAHHACHCAWIYMSWSRLALTLHLDCTFHVSPVEKLVINGGMDSGRPTKRAWWIATVQEFGHRWVQFMFLYARDWGNRSCSLIVKLHFLEVLKKWGATTDKEIFIKSEGYL